MRWMPSHTLLAAGLLALVSLPGLTVSAANPPVFEKDVLPIFEAKCLRCHGAEVRKADLDLRTRPAMVTGGESGPALSPGSFEKSLLWVKVAADKMPPGKQKLSEKEKTLVRDWIEGGARDSGATTAQQTTGDDKQITAADRTFWAFQKPVRPLVPSVPGERPARNPIDAFVLAALQKKGLALSPEADRVTLLRRVYFDLIGLPPSPREVAAFLADDSPDAYERLIDRLLASDHYGERWGRHWLDLAGYADSEGILDADYVRTAAWRYRDWVIRAFNRDKPYDQFLQEQIAGDELIDYPTAYRTQKQFTPEQVEALEATGFLRCASDTSRPDFVNIKNAPGYYYQTLDDTVRIVASATMGLTVQCAKCHSHKYDPIPQTNYYRLQAVFMSAYRPYQWVPQVQRRLLEATEAQEKEAKEHNAKLDAAIAQIRKQAVELNRQFGERLFAERLAKLPESIRDDVTAALAADPTKRTVVQKYLAEKFQKELRPDPKALPAVLAKAYPEYLDRTRAIDAAVRAEEAKRKTFAEIRAIYDLPGEAKTPLLRRGDYLNPGQEVRPGVLAVLATPEPFAWSPPPSDAKTSGRRLAFAKWLTQPDHPLTARVMVNRIWLHHFGEGIVATPDNFGRTGAPPSHPELLDWLATEFVARGWSIKAMHRLLMTSRAYRQASTFDPDRHAAARQADPENRLLWRQRLRRLEAEVLRDGILQAAGTLNPQKYGPPVSMRHAADGEVVVPDDPPGRRRSVYLQVRRSQPLTLLQVFDQPVMETNCTRRGVSTVSAQALTLLNSDFLIRQAEALAARVLRESPNDPAGYAVQVGLARPATRPEKARLETFLHGQAKQYGGSPADARRRALADLAQMLLSSNEFAYVD